MQKQKRPRSTYRHTFRKVRKLGCYVCGQRAGSGFVLDCATAINEHVYLWCCSKEHIELGVAKMKEDAKRAAEAEEGAEAGAT